jgi:shikimate kinase
MMIALIGYRGCGKSSVAKALATRLGWSWQDADVILEERAGCSIREIFARQGERAFRDLESELLAQLLSNANTVVALGGGVVLRPENRRRLREPTVIWLQATPEDLHARIAADPATSERRPNLTSAGGLSEIRELLDERAPLYRECADFIVDTTGKSPEQIASEIVSLVRDVSAQDVGGPTA